MTIRSIYDETTSPAPSGTEFLTQYGALLSILFNESTLTLTNVSGADTITADVEPEMPATGWATGMSFKLTAVADNTGAVTLNVGGAGAKAVVGPGGAALAAGDIVSGTTYLLFYNGTHVRILGSVPGAAGSAIFEEIEFTTTGVFTNSYNPNAQVFVRLWGAGGGSSSVPGGGGEYIEGWFRAGDLAATVTVTIPAASAPATDGGPTSFGSYLTAKGGEAGGVSPGAGAKGGPNGTITSSPWNGGDGATASSNPAGESVNGGGGGGDTFNLGGKSVNGGDGGDNGNPGQTPGGGAGAGNQSGGAGYAIILVFNG